jgi:hypothetical protein
MKANRGKLMSHSIRKGTCLGSLSQCPIKAVDTMGQRNTSSKSTRRSLKT